MDLSFKRRTCTTLLVAALVISFISLASGLPRIYDDGKSVRHNDEQVRQKRNTPEGHTNIVNAFLSDLESNPNNKDIVFLLDRSFAVGHKGFYLREKRLLYTIIRQYFAITPTNYNVAVITFGRDVTTVFDYVSRNSPSVWKCDFMEKTDILDQVQYVTDGQVHNGADIRGAYQAAIHILRNSKNPSNKQYVVMMTAGQFKEGEAPVAELRELLNSPVFGVGVGAVSDTKMKQATHFYANFTYWQQRSQSTDHHIAYMRHPEYHKYHCPCGLYSQCYCDVITGYTKCLCDRGHTLDENEQCVGCPQGYFKERVGNEACEACPIEATVSRSPVPGLAYNSTCFCYNSAYRTYASCPDYCRKDQNDPALGRFCETSSRQCVRDRSLTYPINPSRLHCACLPGITGLFCNQDIQECSTQSCINGGLCVEGHTQFACVCPWGNTGKLCEQNIDECSSAPNVCPAGSMCRQRTVGMYECSCPSGVTDPACDQTGCSSRPCIANSTAADENLDVKRENIELEPSTSQTQSSSFSGTTKLVVIIVPPAVAALVILIVSAVALHRVRKSGGAKHGEKEKSSITGSIVSRNPSLITFDSNCYQDEGTPAVPNLAANFYDIDDSIYGNEPQHKGMDEWYAYVLAVVHNNNLTRLTVVRLDGEKWVLSPGCRLSLSETRSVFNLLSDRVYCKVVTIQGRDFGIASNEDFVIVAHSVENDTEKQEIACATKTRQFVITATAYFQGDEGRCRREIVTLRDHIKQQGL